LQNPIYNKNLAVFQGFFIHKARQNGYCISMTNVAHREREAEGNKLPQRGVLQYQVFSASIEIVEKICSRKKTADKARALRVACFFAISAACLSAQELTLDRALELARANNLTLAARKTALEQAERNAAFSWNSFMPNINLSGNIGNTHPINPSGDPANSWGASGGASLSLNAGIPSNMMRAETRLKSERETYREAELALVSSVSTGFYKLLADKANIEILRDNLQLTRTQYEQTRRNYNSGLASELELLNAEYTYRTAGPAVDDAATAYEASLASYLLTLGLDPKSGYVPAGEITMTALALPAAGELISAYLENRPDVKRARFAVEIARHTQTIERLSSRAPSITLSESISFSPPSGTVQKPVDPFAVAPGDVVSRGTFSIGVSIPITAWIPGSQQSLAIKTNEDAVKEAERALDNTLKLAELDIKKKTAELSQSAEKIGVAELNYKITGRAYELSEQGYRAGLVSQTDLMSARQRMVAARQAVLTAQNAYIDAVYSLASALGLSIDDIYTKIGSKNGTGAE
jgi:multidrug efflux system outer membrane protein